MAFNQPEVVTFLVARDADVSGEMAAILGAKYGSIAALTALMTSPSWLAMSRTERLVAESGLLCSLKDTATFRAVQSLVLDVPALMCYQDAEGRNALHYAADQGKAVPLICALIKEGVDPTATDYAGQTPAEMARDAGHALQVTLLTRAADDKRKRDLQQQQQNRT